MEFEEKVMSEPRNILIASEAGLVVRSTENLSDVISACFGSADGLLLTEDDLGKEFFDLRTGLAGELFQKLINYGVRTAIVAPDPAIHGERIRELALEHTSHPMIRFVPSIEEAKQWLSSPTKRAPPERETGSPLRPMTSG
jgi:hypothetical protein